MLKTLVSQCRELHYGSGADTILRPELTLQRLNRELYALGLNKYLTIFYGVVDLERHVMACSSGGHFPHPILHDGREPRLLPLRGRPIGLFEDSRYECQEVVLPPASLLLLASDGVLELLPGESLTAKQAALLARVRSAGSTLDEITAGLDPDGGRPPADDVTYVLMKRARNHA